MDSEKQIQYWIYTAEEDLGTATVLLNNNKILPCLFFCHLCIEKAIKAHVARCTQQIPPKSHKLSYLISITDLELSEDELNFCAILMTYMLEGRYPDHYPQVPSINLVQEYLQKAHNLFQCLKVKL
ncbi:MAG: HEPN domain-containing protein [Bacteroidetes bacterium]|nr:HEPN domain-containing protein [Bacteroidota bacterium]MBU1720466.1 HEPN domain-containing protein [Bacteroidota bacterium]